MFFIEILKAIFLGIVEGITEWLPISSTGHMILVDEFIKLDVSKEFLDMFMVVIQLGAILAVLVLYFHKLNPFSRKKTLVERKQTWSLWLKVIIACLPAAVIGLIFDDKINELFFNAWTIAITLIVYGVLFIIVEIFNRKRKPKIRELSQLPYTMAFLIGVFQLLALIPGTSRSGVTIITALLLGASRFVAAEFTFFLAIPVMLGGYHQIPLFCVYNCKCVRFLRIHGRGRFDCCRKGFYGCRSIQQCINSVFRLDIN